MGYSGILLVLLGSVFLGGCAKRSVLPQPSPEQSSVPLSPPSPSSPSRPHPPVTRIDLSDPGETLAPIFFDFDQAVLRPESVPILMRHAEMLRRYPALGLVVEGHCDERGTIEYNLALGMRRAQSAVAFFVRDHIEERRLSARSQGEERPGASGHNEAAWAQNRRDEFLVQDAP